MRLCSFQSIIFIVAVCYNTIGETNAAFSFANEKRFGKERDAGTKSKGTATAQDTFLGIFGNKNAGTDPLIERVVEASKSLIQGNEDVETQSSNKDAEAAAYSRRLSILNDTSGNPRSVQNEILNINGIFDGSILELIDSDLFNMNLTNDVVSKAKSLSDALKGKVDNFNLLNGNVIKLYNSILMAFTLGDGQGIVPSLRNAMADIVDPNRERMLDDLDALQLNITEWFTQFQMLQNIRNGSIDEETSRIGNVVNGKPMFENGILQGKLFGGNDLVNEETGILGLNGITILDGTIVGELLDGVLPLEGDILPEVLNGRVLDIVRSTIGMVNNILSNRVDDIRETVSNIGDIFDGPILRRDSEFDNVMHRIRSRIYEILSTNKTGLIDGGLISSLVNVNAPNRRLSLLSEWIERRKGLGKGKSPLDFLGGVFGGLGFRGKADDDQGNGGSNDDDQGNGGSNDDDQGNGGSNDDDQDDALGGETRGRKEHLKKCKPQIDAAINVTTKLVDDFMDKVKHALIKSTETGSNTTELDLERLLPKPIGSEVLASLGLDLGSGECSEEIKVVVYSVIENIRIRSEEIMQSFEEAISKTERKVKDLFPTFKHEKPLKTFLGNLGFKDQSRKILIDLNNTEDCNYPLASDIKLFLIRIRETAIISLTEALSQIGGDTEGGNLEQIRYGVMEKLYKGSPFYDDCEALIPKGRDSPFHDSFMDCIFGKWNLGSIPTLPNRTCRDEVESAIEESSRVLDIIKKIIQNAVNMLHNVFQNVFESPDAETS